MIYMYTYMYHMYMSYNTLGKGIATTPAFLPRESHEQRSLAGYSTWGCQESDMTE